MDFSTSNIILMGAIGAAIIILPFLFKKRPSGLVMNAVQKTKESGDIAPIVVTMTESNKTKDTTLWDMAINALWQSHAREAAADLIVVAIGHDDADILHYWAEKVIEIEPEIAAERFSQEFLEEKYRPMAAASCGGGCGGCS